MKFIFLLAAFIAVFLAAMVSGKKSKALHDRVLILWLFFMGIYIGTYAIYSHELFVHFQLLSISLLSFLMLPGPFLYYYILTLVSDRKQVVSRDLLHLVPFLLFNLFVLASSFLPELSVKLNIEKINARYDPPALFIFFLVLTVLSGPVYFLLTFRLFKLLDIEIFNNFSNPKDIDLFWIRKLVLVFGIIWTALCSVTVIHHAFGLFSMVFCTDGLFLSLSAFIGFIGYFGLKQKIIHGPGEWVDPVDSDQTRSRYSGSRLSEEEGNRLAGKLRTFLESEKPYLNPDLTLSQLAGATNMSSHILSQVINEYYHHNFFDFINQYRIEEFKKRMGGQEYKNFSLLGVAFESGFNSKSAFNRAFKKATGTTPSEYRSAAL